MKIVRLVCLIACLTLISINTYAEATRIQFPKGSSGQVWNGIIKGGNKEFKLWLGKGQTLKVSNGDSDGWYLKAPNGKQLGCNDRNDENDYCSGDGEISSLPYSGDYIISTHYRMTSCANCRVYTTRKITVYFEVR